jgi:tetratricopeptide (TPR) repeat protein
LASSGRVEQFKGVDQSVPVLYIPLRGRPDAPTLDGGAMAAKNPEGYLTIRHQRLPAIDIAAELAGVAELASTVGGDPNLHARLRLLTVEQALAAANEAYFARRYQEAIKRYKDVQGLIFQLLEPGFPRPSAPRPDVAFPLDAALFRPLLLGGLELVEALEPRTIELDFVTVDGVVPQAPLAALERVTGAGVNIADPSLRAVRRDSELAAAYAERGQWRRAELLYRRAQQQLGQAATPEVTAARAALELSLAGVLVQSGRQAEALPLLQRAGAAFSASGDLIGQAQVAVNTAAALAAGGDHDRAAQRLKDAERLIRQTKGLPAATDGTPGPVVGPGPVFGPGPIVVTPAGPLLPTDVLGAGTTVTAAGVIRGGRLGDLLATRPGLTSVTAAIAGHLPTLGAGSIKPDALSEATRAQGLAVTYRHPGKGGGWIQQPVETRIEADEKLVVKQLRVLAGGMSAQAQWRAGDAVPEDPLVNGLYAARVGVTRLQDAVWTWDLPSDLAVQLPHLYLYVIPLALGDCHHALGEYATAETLYLSAASYAFINTELEVPALWQKLAANVLAWGDSLYRGEEPDEALAIYRKVLEPPGGQNLVDGAAPLYSHPKLRRVGNDVRAMLADLANAPGALSPGLAAVVLEIRSRLLQLGAHLDFLGIPTDLVPIWSFDFLQNVARYFAQQAAQAEREFINFQDRAENEALTQQQLQQTAAQADAERELARQQREAADAERSVYQAGVSLAALRRQNAQQNRSSYANMTADRIWIDAAIAWYTGPDYTIKGSGGKKAYEELFDLTYRRGQITRDYELGAMDRQVAELQAAQVVAQQQLSAATARVEAARQAEVVGALRAQAAHDNVDAFSNQFFTPDVWHQMGGFMQAISTSYLHMAVRVARLMQLAYNFEHDLDRRFIRVDYSTNTVKGLLGADALLLDIDNFTYDLLTSVRRKQMPAKITISLAERFPFQFETEFRRSGRIEFETRVEDLDLAFPGTFGQRIESMEVEVEGILPSGGVRGTLTNAGISHYRTEDVSTVKVRLQPRETLVLSEYRVRDDAVVFPADPRLLKVFEGAGAASTWTLELPRAANDVDFDQITDVRLTFYLQTRYSEELATAVRAQLAALPGATRRARTLPMRFAFPDAFFRFSDTGRLDVSLTEVDFRFNERDPRLRRVALLILTERGTDPSGWVVRLGVPGAAGTVPASPNARGEIMVGPGHPWQPLRGGTAVGDYVIELRAAENPALVHDGTLRLDPIRDLVVIMEYDITAEA